MMIDSGIYSLNPRPNVNQNQQNMNKPLYPHSARDRQLFWLSVANAIGAIINVFSGVYWVAIILATVSVFLFSLSYFLPDNEETTSPSDEYDKVISKVATMATQLNELNQFFTREQTRIKNVEATIQKLNEERSALEPLVRTQRETVEAILSAHADRTSRLAWKERLIGFGSGILTSILASIIYEYLTR
jgi:hypothetical protein